MLDVPEFLNDTRHMRADASPLQPNAETQCAISVLIPIFEEEENIAPLFSALVPVLRDFGKPFEIVAVNDGSNDQTLTRLKEAALQIPELRVVSFRRNFGQTAAIMAAIDYSRGSIIVPIDADLQNDPADIPQLVAKLDDGFDVVSGWRKDRRDHPVKRNLLSRLANQMISRVSGVKLKDYGCTLKAYRRDVLTGIRLYGEMHRFIPIYASWKGARITELPVRHHPRRVGSSKYGLERVAKVLLDLMVVKFLEGHFVKPIYVFGGFGLLAIGTSIISILAALYLKFVHGLSLILTPLPLFSAMTFLVGFMSLLMGLLAEMLSRTYFESQGRPAYDVGETINVK